MGCNMLYLQYVVLSSVYTHLSPTHNNNKFSTTLLILNIPSATIIPEVKIL